MEKQKKNDSGITLVALVVSIIVMLVLAGVSLNATIGENGIVTRAQEAALKQRVAEELENLNLELTKLNVDTISTDETMAIQDIANYLVGKGTIDSFVTTSAGQIAAGIDTLTGNKYFFGVKGDNTYRITRGTDGLLSAELTTQTSGGDITGGYALITADSFNNDTSLPETEKGKFTITSDAEVVFMDTLSGALSIYVKSGVHATVGVYANMTLTNQNISRSAIDIEPGGTLDMYIGEGVEVTVNSGYGSQGTYSGKAAVGAAWGGTGGYAGIHVPHYDVATTYVTEYEKDNNGEYIIDDSTGYRIAKNTVTYQPGDAVLNLMGKGTLICIGGNAGNGGGTENALKGGGGGGGAGAGIGGNGGIGGEGSANSDSSRPGYDEGQHGYEGESCGIVNIDYNLNVFAYGGAGGSGGVSTESSGGGGGGYPAAGIGGGGAGGGGGDHINGAGGYSGGNGQYNNTHIPVNGEAGNSDDSYVYVSGCGYFSLAPNNIPEGSQRSNSEVEYERALVPGTVFGMGAYCSAEIYHWHFSYGGDGGVAGKGGTITINNFTFREKNASESNEQYIAAKVAKLKENIKAFNGNRYTDGASGHEAPNINPNNQCPIYAQNGILNEIQKTLGWWTNEDNAYYGRILGSTFNYTTTWGTGANEPVVLRNATTCTTTPYGLGIGSGAGYIETNNGTFTF